MSTLSVSYVFNILSLSRMPARWQNLIVSFWRKLLDPYRPEALLHAWPRTEMA